MDDVDILLTEEEYAAYVEKSPRSAQREREDGTGCPYLKIGFSVRYRLSDVREFVARCLRRSTSESADSARAAETIARSHLSASGLSENGLLAAGQYPTPMRTVAPRARRSGRTGSAK